jgi:hypothetical protein
MFELYFYSLQKFTGKKSIQSRKNGLNISVAVNRIDGYWILIVFCPNFAMWLINWRAKADTPHIANYQLILDISRQFSMFLIGKLSESLNFKYEESRFFKENSFKS